MKKALLSVLAILLLTTGLSVFAQDTPTPTPDVVLTDLPQDFTPTPQAPETPIFVVTPGVEPTRDPNACDVNFMNVSKGTTTARYYLYLSKWMLFSTSGVTGTVTFKSEVWGFYAYRVKTDFTTGAVTIVSRNHVDANVDYSFAVDNLNAPQVAFVFDCNSPVTGITDTTGSNLYSVVDNDCVILNRPNLNGVILPAMYTFDHVYILPIFNVGGSMSITSTVQSFSVHKRIDVLSTVGKWFDYSDGGSQIRGIKEGWTAYQSNQDFTVPLTTFVTSANINAGDADLMVVNCVDVQPAPTATP